jgi:hypothetical protein
MKVDTQPFPNVNMVEGYDRSTRRQLDFMLGINMEGHTSRQQSSWQEADSRDRPQKEERDYITEEQVRHVRNQRPVSSHLLRKYQYQAASPTRNRRRRIRATHWETPQKARGYTGSLALPVLHVLLGFWYEKTTYP